MKDTLGLYYFPQSGTINTRMYVRRNINGITEFRLWDAEHPEIWDRHPWLPLDVVHLAAQLYAGQEGKPGEDPSKLYDIHVAEALLREDGA